MDGSSRSATRRRTCDDGLPASGNDDPETVQVYMTDNAGKFVPYSSLALKLGVSASGTSGSVELKKAAKIGTDGKMVIDFIPGFLKGEQFSVIPGADPADLKGAVVDAGNGLPYDGQRRGRIECSVFVAEDVFRQGSGNHRQH